MEDFLSPRDSVSRHHVLIDRAPPVVWPKVRDLDLSGSRVVRSLLSIRGMSGVRRSFDLEGLGFTLLDEVEPRWRVLGVIGQFWRPSGGLVRLRPDDFMAFDEPGHAKATWSFELDEPELGHTRLTTETRVSCTDDASRVKFERYWRVVGPFSGLIRSEILKGIKRQAENR